MDVDWRCWYSLFILWEFVQPANIDNSNRKVLILPDNLVGAEIGVHSGKNTLTLLSHIPWIKKLYCVDRWEEYENYSNDDEHNFPKSNIPMEEIFNKFKKTISFFKHKVEIIRMDSVLASYKIEDESLDFVFIDGNHEYEYVRKDILAWLPKVKVGGIISGHDYITFEGQPEHRYDVKKAVDELIPNRNVHGTIWWAKIQDKVVIKEGENIE